MQEKIQPEFDVYEFVELYSKRKIDIEEEGYEIIPEVREYFEKYPIKKELAGFITELNQGDINLELMPFWGGGCDTFTIQSVEDAKMFPNLKKITIYYEEKPKLKLEIEAMGLEADYY